MGSCNSSEVKTNNRPLPSINRNPEYFSSKGEKLSDLKGYDDSPSQKIEMFIFLKDVERAKYSLEVLQKIDNIESTLGKTQEVEGTYVDFMTSFTLNYYFEKEQHIMVKLKTNSIAATYNYTVGRLMGAMGQRIMIPLQNGFGNIIVQAQNTKNDTFEAKININLINKKNRAHETYYLIERDISNKSTQYIKSYKSEVLPVGQATFKATVLSLNSLNDNIQSKPFRIQFFETTGGDSFGFQQIRVDAFNQSNGFKNRLALLDKNGNPVDSYEIEITITLKKIFRFVDFLRGGMQISLIVGIDFTASNKSITDSTSLHFCKPNEPNLYEKAILSCGSIVAYYDYDQKFPSFGYGAILPGRSNEDVSHCFPINFSNDPNIYTIQNIALAYRECVKQVRFYGPTNFAPIILETINICKYQQNKDIYYILMILTDGKISDLPDTIDAIIQASYLPISLIIIGIGDADFADMERLDADINPLVSRKGERANRDLVQFVEFNKLQNNGVKLAEEVLMEIPSQVEYFYKINNREPNQPINLD